MTSFFLSKGDPYYDRRSASSPGPSMAASQGDPQESSIRGMRLKVLYTFDDESKTNCLARWPTMLNIRTAHLDESTQIGVVELKSCLQAVVAASPELVAKLGQDYTVYAYDYSEYDTPLVGQGMLSWILASSTAASTASQPSRTMVTGRVCKNGLGLFSNGAQETLEVKLRLVPMPTCLQSEYLESIRRYHDISKVMPAGFDAQSWADVLKANPEVLSGAQISRAQSPASVYDQANVGIEHVQRLLNDGYAQSDDRHHSSFQRRDSFASSTGGQDLYRNASPTPGLRPASTRPGQQIYERPDSQASNRAFRSQKASRRNSIDSVGANNEEMIEDGPVKKRAKIMKADAPSRKSFGKQVDSLRVAASTAASVRVYQPTAVRPSANAATSLEDQPRIPTPVPRLSIEANRPYLLPPRSGLGRQSFSINEPEYNSPYLPSEEGGNLPDSAMTSPDPTRSQSVAVYTPAEPGSSPPEIPRRAAVTPSSPMLPALPQHDDSGFMSGSIDELFDDPDEDNKAEECYEEATVTHYGHPHEHTLNMNMPNPGQYMAPSAAERMMEESKIERAKIRARTNAANAVSLPVQKRGTLHRSQTWSGGQQPSSDIGSDKSESSKTKPGKGWNKNKRKAAIQSRLASSIAAGEMPPFCDNCGAIETPTWRRAYARIYDTSEEIPDESSGIVAVEVLERFENGSTKLFKVFKKSILASDEGFKDILLCNPCGLWLANNKCVRPPQQWKDKPQPKRGGSRKKKDPTAQMAQNPMMQQSNINQAPEAQSSSNTGEGAQDASTETEKPADNLELPPIQRRGAFSTPSSPPTHRHSDRAIIAAAENAFQRSAQSSPGRLEGTRHSPIELDLDGPEPLRRSLFPSPQRSGVLGQPPGGDLKLSPLAPYKSRGLAGANASPVPIDRLNKENLPPYNPTAAPPAIGNFFPIMPIQPHAHRGPTPTPPAQAESPSSNPFKTPSKPSPNPLRRFATPDFFSSAAKAFLHPPRTPTRTPTKHIPASTYGMDVLSPFTRHLNELLSESTATESPGRFLGGAGGIATYRDPCSDFDIAAYDATVGREEPVPSSPPIAGWFGVYEDPIEGTDELPEWHSLAFGSSPFKEMSEGMGSQATQAATADCSQ